jgi:hypothetical protein
MKPESPLLACFAKIEWAKTEIDNLAKRIDDLFANKPVVILPLSLYRPAVYPFGINKLTSKIDANGIEVWRYAIPKIPTDLNVTTGAILHSLRSPLDQMLSAIALQTHDSPSGVAFPFGRTRDEFKTAIAKQKKLPPDALKMIEVLKPYRVGGNALLYALHALNIPDKHHPGLVPVNLQTLTDMQTLIVRKGYVLTFGPRTGRHMILDTDNNMAQPDSKKAPVITPVGGKAKISFGHDVGKFKPRDVVTIIYNQMGTKRPAEILPYLDKIKLPPDTPKDDMEIATSVPGTKFEAEFYPSLNVALSEIEGFERQPVVAVLHQMRQLVERILLTFEKRFFS